MATPDDDAALIEAPAEDETQVRTRALVPATPANRLPGTDALSALSAWAKTVWPTLGWRQPA